MYVRETRPHLRALAPPCSCAVDESAEHASVREAMQLATQAVEATVQLTAHVHSCLSAQGLPLQGSALLCMEVGALTEVLPRYPLTSRVATDASHRELGWNRGHQRCFLTL